VPYIDANEVSISGRQPPASSDHCVNGGNPDAIWSEAKQKAKIYISELSSQSKSMNSTSGNIQLN
jgi:hypothetical protein